MAGDYVHLFEIKLKLKLDFLDGPIVLQRDLYGAVGGFQVHVYSNEHGRPHVHVLHREKGVSAKFTIHGAECIEGCESLRGRHHRGVREYIEEEGEGLLQKWEAKNPEI